MKYTVVYISKSNPFAAIPPGETQMAPQTRSARLRMVGTDDWGSSVGTARQGIFRKEGECWTIGYGAKTVRLKDTRGLAYLAHLLRYPAVEFHVLDLLGETTSQRKQDETSQSELRSTDALTKELSRAVGLGGRSRRAGSATERARQSITKTIKSVLERIAQADATLGDLFSRCIRTGTFCSYQPDLDFPIAWEFDATDNLAPARVEPTRHPAQAARVVLESFPFSATERSAFVGRESEGSAIRAAIDRALGGQGSLIMLWGEPGVGKTRLAMEMTEYALRIGFRYAVGRCYERDEPFPYLPFVEMLENGLAQAASLDDFRRRMGENAPELAQLAPSLRRIFPDIPRPLELPPAQQSRHLFQSVSEGLADAAQTHPQLLILEDLHWADESTLTLLIHLASLVAQLPVVIIGTYRGGHSRHNRVLARTLEELIRLGIRPLKLSDLSLTNSSPSSRRRSR
jgi:hypothetical protein